MNKFMIIGKAAFTPEIKVSESGLKYSRLILNKGFKKKDNTWDNQSYTIILFANTAELVSKVILKDCELFLEGEIKGHYDKEKKDTKYTFIGHNFQVLNWPARKEEKKETPVQAFVPDVDVFNFNSGIEKNKLIELNEEIPF